jgi:hypothetical protein
MSARSNNLITVNDDIIFAAAKQISVDSINTNTISERTLNGGILMNHDLRLPLAKKITVSNLESASAIFPIFSASSFAVQDIDPSRFLAAPTLKTNLLDGWISGDPITVNSTLNFNAAKTMAIDSIAVDSLEARTGNNIAVADLLVCNGNLLTNTINSVNFTDPLIVETDIRTSVGKYTRTNLRTGLITGQSDLTTDTILVDSILNCGQTVRLSNAVIDNTANDIVCRNGSNNLVRQSHRTILNKSRIENYIIGGNLIMSSPSSTNSNVLFSYEVSSFDQNFNSLSLFTFDHTTAVQTQTITIALPNTITNLPYHNIIQDMTIHIAGIPETIWLVWNTQFATIRLSRKNGLFPAGTVRFGLDPIIQGEAWSSGSLQINYYNAGMTYL